MDETPLSPSSAALVALADSHSTHNYSPLPVVLAKGEGAWVFDIDGNKYLDMVSAYSALNFGHSHPKIIACAKRQLETLTLVSRAFHSEQFSYFCQELSRFCGLPKVVAMNSGAEAVETAIKIARRWGYEEKKIPENEGEIIVFDNNFHGRTTTIISFSDSAESRRGFGPFTPGFKIIPYGCYDSLASSISSHTIAVLIEPIQGEAGVVLPPSQFLVKVRELCSRHRVLFIADEIQTGFGRTGKRFACDHDNVVPDMYILGKSLGGGVVPISAVVGTKEVMDVLTPGSHGSTFGGNPFACAIAREVLTLLNDTSLYDSVTALGEFFRTQLQELHLPFIKEIRGKGLLCGVEFDPSVGKAKKIALSLMKKGILCKDTRDYTLRFAPPLIISKDQLVWSIDRIKDVLVKLG